MSLSLIKRRPFTSFLLLLVIVLLALGWSKRTALAAFPDIISAYTAKEYCSCRYVMDNPADYCLAYVKQYVPTSRFVDDVTRKQVSVSGLGRSNTAAWLSPRQGCQLLPTL